MQGLFVIVLEERGVRRPLAPRPGDELSDRTSLEVWLGAPLVLFGPNRARIAQTGTRRRCEEQKVRIGARRARLARAYVIKAPNGDLTVSAHNRARRIGRPLVAPSLARVHTELGTALGPSRATKVHRRGRPAVAPSLV